ncbi:YqaJ viral recombinase family protein [Geobacillus sp. FSL W8-1251]|uniref:YqaJ viral recombinase family nuclease n=2 Tax=Geobacillus sp. FSL W8-1251 TaxID=2954650 RepID=UPI0030F6FB1B
MDAVILANTSEMSHEEWLQARTCGLGGSDASVVLGLNRYKTPFELWLEKTGQVTPQSSTSEAAYFGTLLEDLVAKEFEKRSGKKVRKRNAMFQHPEHEFILANIDRFIVGEKAILECKTASAFLAKEWEGDDIPEAYIVQMQHYLGVLGPEYKKGYFAVLIGGQKFIWKEIERDDELIEMIFQAEIDFWNNHVLKKNPPMFDGSDASSDLLKTLYPTAKFDEEIELPPHANELIAKYEQAKQEEAEAAERRKEAENQLKAMLGDYERAFAGDRIVTWKNVHSSRVDMKLLKEKYPEIYQEVVKETVSRRFSIK